MTQEEITNTIEKRKMMRMNSIWDKKRKQDKKRYVRVALLGPGQIFGEEEVTNENDYRQNRAVVASYSA